MSTEPKPKKQRTPAMKRAIVRQVYQRLEASINRWQHAQKRAEDLYMPRRYDLNDMYKTIILDAHLVAQRELRKQKTLVTSTATSERSIQTNTSKSKRKKTAT